MLVAQFSIFAEDMTYIFRWSIIPGLLILVVTFLPLILQVVQCFCEDIKSCLQCQSTPSYWKARSHLSSWSIPWLLMTRLLKSPGYRQTCYRHSEQYRFIPAAPPEELRLVYVRTTSLVITLPADALAPGSAKPSAGTILTERLDHFCSNSVMHWRRTTRTYGANCQ